MSAFETDPSFQFCAFVEERVRGSEPGKFPGTDLSAVYDIDFEAQTGLLPIDEVAFKISGEPVGVAGTDDAPNDAVSHDIALRMMGEGILDIMLANGVFSVWDGLNENEIMTSGPQTESFAMSTLLRLQVMYADGDLVRRTIS